MARIKRKSAVLEAARKRLAGLKAIETPNLGTNLTEAIFTAKITSLSNRLDSYNTLLTRADEEQNELEKEEAETAELSRRFLAAAEAQHGPDSNEYEMLGGTRTSDRKKPIEEEFKQRGLVTNCLVPVRIIKTKEREVLDEVVTASNNQNKMTPRNLKSNSRVQRVLQRKFDELQFPWFYERKDGEFDSIKEYPSRTIKPKNYQNGKITRTVSNEAIAKTWLSFIGMSSAASENINVFDLIDDNGRYEWLFDRKPNEQHWKAVTLGPQIELVDENFDPSPPTSHQYLLSYLIFEFAKAYLPSPQLNKKKCLDRLIQSKKITAASSHEDINKSMMADNEYVLNKILSNMKEVIVELFALILVKTYGPVDPLNARKTLDLDGLSYSLPILISSLLLKTSPRQKLLTS